jgi:hypothetical protein
MTTDNDTRRDLRLAKMHDLAHEIGAVRAEEEAQAADLKTTRKKREAMQEELEALAGADDAQTDLFQG